jgi:hypothetical protein
VGLLDEREWIGRKELTVRYAVPSARTRDVGVKNVALGENAPRETTFGVLAREAENAVAQLAAAWVSYAA